MTSRQLNILLGVLVIMLLGLVTYVALGSSRMPGRTLSQQNTALNSNSAQANANHQQPLNNTNTPTQHSVNASPIQTIPQGNTANWKTYSNNIIGVSLKYPANFQITYQPKKDHRILISDRAVTFPEVGGNTAPIAVGKILSGQDLNTILDGLQSKTETRITVDGQTARRIQGYQSPYPNQKILQVLVVIDSKDIVISGSAIEREDKTVFDLLPALDEIVSTLSFTK